MFSVATLHQWAPLTLFSGQRFDRVHMQGNWLQAPEVHGPGAGALCFYKMCALRLCAWGYPSSLSKVVRAGELEQFGGNDEPLSQTGKLSGFKMPSLSGTQELNEFMEAANISLLSQNGQGEPFPKLDFSTLLFDSNQYLFTNPKDRFYALLALGTNTGFQEFEAKYSDSESVEDVCYRFTVRLLLNGHCGEVLSLAGYRSRQSTSRAKMPSWIPDWTAPAKSLGDDGSTMCFEMAEHQRWADAEFDRLMNQVKQKGGPTWQDKYTCEHTQRSIAALKRLGVGLSDLEKTNEDSEGGWLLNLCPEYRLYRASLESKPECQIQNEKLLIKGSRVDNVILVLPGALDRAPLFYEDAVRALLKEYPTKEPLIEAIWRTLIANRAAWVVGHRPQKAPDEYGEDFKLAKLLTGNQVVDLSWKTGLEPPDLYRSLAWTRGRYKLCITYGGYIGLLPLNAKLRDEIAVFHGCDTPFVIRLSATHQDRAYTVIGECYIHGMMKGELFENPRFPVETITLH